MSLSAQAGSEVNTNTSPDCIIADDRPIAPPFDHELSTATTACPLEPVTVPCIGTNTVNLLRIPINFKAIGTLALVDTGSVASLLAERIFLKISSDCVREKPVFQSFVSAGGHPIESCGCFRIPVKLPGFQTSQQFYVIKNLQEDCILGLDFLSQHKTSFSGSRVNKLPAFVAVESHGNSRLNEREESYIQDSHWSAVCHLAGRFKVRNNERRKRRKLLRKPGCCSGPRVFFLDCPRAVECERGRCRGCRRLVI